MKSLSISEARAKFSALVEEVRDSRRTIEIRRRNQPAVYLVEAETFKRLQGIEDCVRTEQLRQALNGERFDLEEVIASIDLEL